MHYYDIDKNKREVRRWGLMGLLLYGVAAAGLLGWMVLTLSPHEIPLPQEVIVLVEEPEPLELPEVEEAQGGGEGETPPVEVKAPKVAPPPVVPKVRMPPALTDNRSTVEAPVAPPRPRVPLMPKAEPTPEPPRPRTVNPNAMFHGAQAPPPPPQPDPPQPTGEGEGQGVGVGDGSVTGFGGRSLVGALPQPTYPKGNVEGRVAIKVTIDAAGRVRSADYTSQGSTTSNKALIDAARAAAWRARFTEAETMAQTGTIVYTFSLN